MNNKIPVYCSWIALVIFVIVLIFQPKETTFYAFRPSDAWLLLCLFLQVKTGYNITTRFSGRFLIRNYGLIIGVLAIIATLIQATYANYSLNISFAFHFYRFLRFLLIFKFVENIIFDLSSENVRKFWKAYTLTGLVVVILSFFEFYDIQPFKMIIMNQYYDVPDITFEASLLQVERLVGVMGNANATAILLVSTLPYPLLRIGTGKRMLIKILYISYIFAVVYVLIVMSGSRTAIFISILLPLVLIIVASRRLNDLLFAAAITLFLGVMGLYFYQRFESDIIIQDRITEKFSGSDVPLSAKGLGEWVNRYELWLERLYTFKSKGNELSILIGMGYTKAYNDTTDNGLISAFINNGLIGLLLKLLIFYIFIRFGLLSAIRYYRCYEIDISMLAFAISALALLLWESTADMTEHYKFGQLFYLLISIALIINGKIFSKDSHEVPEDI